MILKSLKSPVSEHLWSLNMVKAPKHGLNHHGIFFCHNSLSLWRKMSLKNSVFVLTGILRHFVNILTADEKCSLSVKASVSRNQYKCNYLKIKKYFLNFFLHFNNPHKILNYLEKKISLRGYLFLKL